jgi:hypothetical protein
MAKANAVTSAEALNAIKGGEQTNCHEPIKNIAPVKCDMPTMKEELLMKNPVVREISL